LRHSAEIVVELLAAVTAKVTARDFLIAEVRHDDAQIVDATVHGAHRAGREARVAAAQRLRRAFQQQHRCTGFTCRNRRAQRRITTADHDHIGIEHR